MVYQTTEKKIKKKAVNVFLTEVIEKVKIRYTK